MSDSRARMLARIRAATEDLPDETVEIPRRYLTGLPEDGSSVDVFSHRLDAYGAAVHRCTEDGLPDAVDRALRDLGARSAVVPAGLPEAWLARWAGRDGTTVHGDRPPLSAARLDRIDAVVTTCAAAIADSGTIVLDGGPGQGRRAPTLIPDRHVCVVPAGRIGASVPEVIGRLDPRRPLTWFSGPSATVDIEMIRVQGVHGPRHIAVLIVG